MPRFGVPGQNVDPLSYADSRLATVPVVNAPRRPTTTDKKYPMWCEWRVNKNATAPELEGEFWKLIKFESNGDATWVMINAASGGTLDDIRDQVNVQVTPDASGNIDIDGNVVANAANPSGIPLETVADTGTNTLDINLQVAAARTGAPGDKDDAGLCSFDDTAFAVDADGYVTLAGGAGPAIDSVNIDSNTGPGTDPVLPTAGGQITVAGAAVAAHSVPIETHSRAANAYNIEVQYAEAAASTTATSSGISHFDSGAFAVDASGFVTLLGDGTAAVSFPVDANTAPGTDPVVPDGSGQVTVAGAAVAAHTVPVEIHSRAANAYNVEVQVADAITGAPGDKDDAGICSFDDTKFTVDGDGYVSLAAGIGSGSLVYLAIATASASSELTFTTNIDSTYSQYLFIFDNLVSTTTNYLDMQTSTDGGSNYDSTSGDYKWAIVIPTTSANSHAGSSGSGHIRISGEQIGNQAGNSLSGWMTMHNPSNASAFTQFNYFGCYAAPTASPTVYKHFSGGGVRFAAEDVDAVRFFMDTDDIASGSIRLYGIKNS